MTESDSEEAFHSAGEEDIPDLPSPKPKDETAESKVETSSSSTSSSKEAKNSSNQTSKKSKKKRNKGKSGLQKTTEEQKEQSEETRETTDFSREETNRCSGSEIEEKDLRSADDEGDTKVEESQPRQSDQTFEVEKPVTESIQVKDSPLVEEHELQNVDGHLKESADPTKKSDFDHQEQPKQEEISEEVLEAGNQIIRDVQDGSSKLDKKDENEASTSKYETGHVSRTEEGSGWNASLAGALGKLTGEKTGEQKESSGGGWGWGGWGSSFVSSVSAMGHGLSSVIENVETSLGLPKPEELTEQEKREQEFIVTQDEQQEPKEEIKKEDSDKKEHGGDAGDERLDEKEVEQGGETEGDNNDKTSPGDKSESSSMMKGFLSYGASAITTVVGKTVTGGLDALETIGRKTMDVLQEGDHSHVMGRGRGDKGNLSEMLRDAKEEAETTALLEEEEKELQRAHFGILFDQYQGLAHLEALEMISNQSESRVQGSLNMLSGDDLQSLKTELIEIRDAFQLEELESEEQPEGSEQDFVNSITEHLFGVSVASTPDKLQRVQRSVHDWLAERKTHQEAGQKQDIKELHIKAIESLAEFSSRVIEQFHKACELMLLPQDKEHSKSPLERATSLSKLTSVLAAEVSNQASKFGDCLNREASNQEASNQEENETNDDVNPLITNIYLEASNSTSYIQDAFQLVLPVLQMVAVERKREIPS